MKTLNISQTDYVSCGKTYMCPFYINIFPKHMSSVTRNLIGCIYRRLTLTV